MSRSHSWRNSILILLCILLPSIIFILPLVPWFNKTTYDEYNAIYYYLLSVGTLFLGLIAYIQLSNINESLEIDYLLKINQQLRRKEIIKARTIIHELYLMAQNELQAQGINIQNKEWKSKLHKKIGYKIKKLSTSNEKQKFLYLLNFLDFMETVGYLYTNNHLTLDNLDKLFGASLIFNFKIYKSYILHRQRKHKIGDFYKEFKKLYYDLKERNRKRNRKQNTNEKIIIGAVGPIKYQFSIDLNRLKFFQ